MKQHQLDDGQAEKKLRFAVIIPTYNSCSYLLETIASVFAQTRPPDEVIVVDDGSSDDTVAVVQSEFPSVILISEPNKGQSIARNTGIARAQSDWLCFLDQDDLWHREKLEKVEGFLHDNPDCQALVHPVWYFSLPGGPDSQWGLSRDFVANDLAECHAIAEHSHPVNDSSFLKVKGTSYAALLKQHFGIPSATIVERDLAIRAGCFPPGHFEDWRFSRNVARLTEWHMLAEHLAFSRFHDTQTTNLHVKGPYLLAAYVEAWWGGRNAPDANADLATTWDELQEFAKYYRPMTQEVYWEALKSRDHISRQLTSHLGAALLPRLRDRIFIRLPLPLSVRWDRLRGGSKPRHNDLRITSSVGLKGVKTADLANVQGSGPGPTTTASELRNQVDRTRADNGIERSHSGLGG